MVDGPTRHQPADRRDGAIARAWPIAGTPDIGIALTWYPLTAGARILGIYQGIAIGTPLSLLATRPFARGPDRR